MADQASGNNEVHIQLKLKQTDAKILQAIEEALRRIEEVPTASAATAATRSRRRG
jgi:RNA polymerase-binding transcription factor DksA